MKIFELINLLKDKQVYVLSPHYDDAVLSCGMLMAKLSPFKNVSVVNCFTKAHAGRYTLSAQKFLKDCGNYNNANDLSDARKKEDKAVLEEIGVRILDLGIQEALFRVKKNPGLFGSLIPEFAHIYPTFRWHILGKISPADNSVKVLKELFGKCITDSIIIAPIGIGNHVDHAAVRIAAQDKYKNIIFYEDFPYNIRSKIRPEFLKEYKKFELAEGYAYKKDLLNMYGTQINNLFVGGVIPEYPERYYIGQRFFHKI